MAHGTLYLVSTPIGNLADLSDRALSVLESVVYIYAEDTRRTGNLLRHFGRRTSVRSLHEHNEAGRVREVIARLGEGADCALVSDAGTPTVSDPGTRLVASVSDAGFQVVPIPGPSAVTAAIAVSGLPAGRFVFLGFAPRRGASRARWIDRALTSPDTVVAFEAPGRIGHLLAELRERGAGDRRCVVCRELTKLYEETRRGTVETLEDYYSGADVLGELTVVLEGRGSGEDEAIDEDEVLRVAAVLVTTGCTTREIAKRLRQEFGLTRNQAYDFALQANERG